MVDAFISYSRKDAGLAGSLHKQLNAKIYPERPQAPLDIYMDHYLEAGTDWWKRLQTKLGESNHFIVILSNHYLASEICNKELKMALDRRMPILPIRIVAHLQADDWKDTVSGEIHQGYRGLQKERQSRGDWNELPILIADDHLNRLQTLHGRMLLDATVPESFINQIAADIFVDVEHKDMWTRVLNQSARWKEGSGSLLSGKDLEAAEIWQTRAAGKQPLLLNEHTTYLLASRTAQRRRWQQLTSVFGTLFVAAVVAAIIAF